MYRFFVYILVCLCGSGSAAQICDGRYADATTLIEQAYTRYGTLYSGGHAYDSIGPTLEIYRFLSGLPSSGITDPRTSPIWIDPPSPPSMTPKFAGETLARSLPRLSDPDFRKNTSVGSTDIEVLLNRLTVVGPYAGWWLTPDAPHLSAIEKVIATYAVDNGLDWVLTVQAASARPHAFSWVNRERPERTRGSLIVFEHSLDHYVSQQNLTWFVAVMLSQIHIPWSQNLSSARDNTLASVHARLADLQMAVVTCTATEAEYVAASIGTFEEMRFESSRTNWFPNDMNTAFYLPPMLRRMTATQLGKVATRPTYWRHDMDWDTLLQDLADDPAFDRWLAVGRSYDADTLAELIAVNDGIRMDPKVVRLLNLLSVDDMLTFANTRQDFKDEYRDIITAVFLRLFSLGRDNEAAGLIDEMHILWPDLEIISEWYTRGTQEYRLARVALALPEPRTLLTPNRRNALGNNAFRGSMQDDYRLHIWSNARRSRDLPLNMRTGGFMTRDIQHWMSANGSASSSHWAASRRANQRGIPVPDSMCCVRTPLPTSSRYNADQGIAGFAAWEELSRLGPETGLANRIGKALVQNARDRTDTLIERALADREALADELAFVIRQGRRMIHGEMYGRPLGRVAFETLHNRLGRTDAAARTPYWFTCQERCAP